MTTPTDAAVDAATVTRTRRAVLGGAVAAAVAVTVGTFAKPEPVRATTGTMQYGTSQSAGSSATNLYSVVQGGPTFGAGNDATDGIGLFGEATAAGGIAIYGHSFESVAVIGSGGASAPALTGRVGVFGYSDTGTGVAARSDTGTALKVTGKASFTRSGRASVAAGKSYADVDLTAKGGLGGTPLCFAVINTRRAGVHVETVRPNDPSTGKLRIYLNKVASSTSSTSVSWVVLG